MTDEELIKRLREGATWDDDVAAADRIEQLKQLLDEMAQFLRVADFQDFRADFACLEVLSRYKEMQ